MKRLSCTAAYLALLIASAAAAAVLSAIPHRYHGRWAPDAAACADTSHFTKRVEISASGWRSFEEGADVVGVLSVRGGSHRFRVDYFAGGDHHEGTLTLKLRGTNRLTMSHVNQGQKKSETLIRCR